MPASPMKLSLCAASLTFAVFALSPPALALAADAAASPFDGPWMVQLSCPDTNDRKGFIKGYEFTFDATISGGHLEGQHGTAGASGSLTFSGTVASDGALAIQATGNTGNPDYVVGKVAQGSAYGYTMTGKLEGARGQAQRDSRRPCVATFTKR